MSWRGTPLNLLPSLSTNNANLPPVTMDSSHKVMIKLPLPANGEPEPFPVDFEDIWDEFHVRMPNSPKSLYPKKSGKESLMVPRWQVICEAYKKPIKSIDELHQVILRYNGKFKWEFAGLKNLFRKEMSEEEELVFFGTTLPGIIELVLSTPNVVTSAPPLLGMQTNCSITMSQKQVACLLANAFLCTFPERNEKEYSHYPSINFSSLFNFDRPITYEKLKCIFQYFKEIALNGRDGVITFSRQYISPDETPDFSESENLLPKLHVTSEGGIEEADGFLQMDFADPYIGGRIYGIGCVQEEIRFLLSPELIVTRLFTEYLQERDSCIITGAEQFSKGKGYASKFKWKSPHFDSTERDDFRRKLNQVVALDATNYRRRKHSVQYSKELIMRDMIKAYAGFRVIKNSEGIPVAIATGNWGCGIFRGNPHLKGLLQMIAASEAGRDVVYFTFKDQMLRDDLFDMHRFLTTKEVTVGQLVKILFEYGARPNVNGKDLYQYIRSKANTL